MLSFGSVVDLHIMPFSCIPNVFLSLESQWRDAGGAEHNPLYHTTEPQQKQKPLGFGVLSFLGLCRSLPIMPL